MKFLKKLNQKKTAIDLILIKSQKMKLSEIKNHLNFLESVEFSLPDGRLVPAHFHVTEIGKIQKQFVDCGGELRYTEVINFQLWSSDDYDHRLSVSKLQSIIKISEEKLALDNLKIEVEYQDSTIGKYHLDFDGKRFLLIPTQTDCLARDKCNVEPLKETVNSQCLPSSGCC